MLSITEKWIARTATHHTWSCKFQSTTVGSMPAPLFLTHLRGLSFRLPVDSRPHFLWYRYFRLGISDGDFCILLISLESLVLTGIFSDVYTSTLWPHKTSAFHLQIFWWRDSGTPESGLHAGFSLSLRKPHASHLLFRLQAAHNGNRFPSAFFRKTSMRLI